MALSIPAFCSAAMLALLLVPANAASAIQNTRHANLRYQKGMAHQPDANAQEALTREELLDSQSAPQAAAVPPASMPALPQMQAAAVLPASMPALPQMQAQQLLQAQAAQMQQMQKMLQQQQQELHRLQQLETQKAQPVQQPRQQHKRAPARKSTARQAPKKSLVRVNAKLANNAHAQVMTKTELESGSSGIAKPKGWDQCLKFARFVKTQDVTGLELVRVWKSTCEPAVQSGRATERYKLMCNSLSGVVEPYSAQIDYDVEQLCDSVLAVFHDVTAVDAKAR